MKKKFYSNGKLLLTGEYAVLDGAKALALPTKFGQDLVVEETDSNLIHWKSYDSDGSVWFDETFSIGEIGNPKLGLNEIKNTLIKILHEASILNPNAFQGSGFAIETHLTFPKSWGLGTSSTFINNISQWLGVDGFMLLQKSFGGSGYDIACAQHHAPLVYQLENGKPIVEEVPFNLAFKDQLYFVYLNRKQSSRNAIASYKNNPVDSLAITEISDITERILDAKDLHSFSRLIERHENILSGILGLTKVQDRLFPDFNGTIKSLGAWGGDFVLAVAEENPQDYFAQKCFGTILQYSEMVL